MRTTTTVAHVIPCGHAPEAAEAAAQLWLDARGIICDCDHGAEQLFNAAPEKLLMLHIASLLPQLRDVNLLHDDHANPRLHFSTHIGRRYQAVTLDGACFFCQLCLTVLDTRAGGRVSLIVRPIAVACARA